MIGAGTLALTTAPAVALRRLRKHEGPALPPLPGCRVLVEARTSRSGATCERRWIVPARIVKQALNPRCTAIMRELADDRPPPGWVRVG